MTLVTRQRKWVTKVVTANRENKILSISRILKGDGKEMVAAIAVVTLPVSSHFLFSSFSPSFVVKHKVKQIKRRRKERGRTLGTAEFPSSGKERDITCSTGDLGRWEMIRREKR